MSLTDFFLQLAKDRVWANQHADRHAVFEMRLLTNFTGVKHQLTLPFLSTHMPDHQVPGTPKTFLVYEVGGLEIISMGIDSGVNLAHWISFSELVSTCKMFAIPYSKNRLFNLDSCFMRMTTDGTIIVAIDRESNLSRLGSIAPVYIRLYSNVNTEALGYTGTFVHDSAVVSGSVDYNAFRNTYNAETNAFAFMNGFYMPEGFPTFASLLNGNNVEMQYFVDPEIINFITIDKSDFVTFDSIKDGVPKYIACSPEDSDNMYVDDLEFYVSGIYTKPLTGQTARYGLYMPRSSDFKIRQLTFKDWCFSVVDWNQIESNLSAAIGGTLTNFQLHVIVRKSGNVIDYIQDSNRIPDLMNLPVDIRKQCFTNTDPLMDIWQAAILEDCPFNKWLGLRSTELTEENMYYVFSSYGAVKTVEGVLIDKPTGDYRLPLITHNAGGKLIYFVDGLKDYNDDVVYPASPTDGLLYLNGNGSELFLPDINASADLDTVVNVGEDTSYVETGFGILCYYQNGTELALAEYQLDYTYEDIAGNAVITWEPHMLDKMRFIRTANRRVDWQGTLSTADIENGFDIYNGRAKANDVGMGKSMIWYKGHYLIEGLDYVLLNSNVHLCSKFEWQDTGPESIEVIYAGLPHWSLHHNNSDEWGFIARGKLSYDNRYDLYNNRHRMIVANGRVVPPDEIFTAESYEEINNGSLDPVVFPNGTPWAAVNLPRFSRSEELEEFSIPAHNDVVIDGRIETFLSSIYPQATETTPIVISSKYDLFSPFLNKIIQDIINNVLVIPNSTLTDSEIDDLVDPYRHLISICPSQRFADRSYIDIHPIRNLDPVTVNVDEYWFINRVNLLYLNGKVTYINRYLHIS